MIRWKVGQLRPGATVEFKRITFDTARRLASRQKQYLNRIREAAFPQNSTSIHCTGDHDLNAIYDDGPQDPKLHVLQSSDRAKAIFRQVGLFKVYTFCILTVIRRQEMPQFW